MLLYSEAQVALKWKAAGSDAGPEAQAFSSSAKDASLKSINNTLAKELLANSICEPQSVLHLCSRQLECGSKKRPRE